MTQQNLIFVTGAIRSGTTLLTRLLAQSLGSKPAMQPVPLVLVRMKAEFLKQSGAPQWQIDYPLSDDIFETAFSISEFVRFISNRRVDRETALKWMNADQTYSGTQFSSASGMARLQKWKGGTLSSMLKNYLLLQNREQTPVVWKEVFGESYLPYLIDQRVPSVIIIRDPRDVILSQNSGSSENHVGAIRPLLYQIRQWRKSVAWALWLEEQSLGFRVQFETLISAPEVTIQKTLRSLISKPIALAKLGDFDPGSNSSFNTRGRLDPSVVGRHKHLLGEGTKLFIEAACLPEMRYLGYVSDMRVSEALLQLERTDVDMLPPRLGLEHYCYTKTRSKEELLRLRSLQKKTGKFQPETHISREGFDKLSYALHRL